MGDDELLDAVLAMSGKDAFALAQDEWSMVAEALAFEVTRQRAYIRNLREDLHKYEDCPSCPADAGEPHTEWCTDHPRNQPAPGGGPGGQFLSELGDLVRDYEGGVL